MSEQNASKTSERLSSGIPGLDEVLHGGFLAGRAYLICGGPGNGKTTLGAHFLRAGAEDEALFISLSERPTQLIEDMARRGIDLSHVQLLDLRPSSDELAKSDTGYSIFDPGVSEGPATTQRIVAAVEQRKPKRVLIDSLTHIRYLNSDPYVHRRQVASLLTYLHEQGCTVLGTAEASKETPDEDLRYLCDGVIFLDRIPERTVEVSKFRGSDFVGGRHAMRLTDTGLIVYPRLIPGPERPRFEPEVYSSGVPSIDKLLGGGLERGSIIIMTGPTGVGKTTLAFQFLKEAAGRGERSVAYVFEERKRILQHRCEAIGMPLSKLMARGTLSIEPVEPLRFSVGEFSARVREEVEVRGAQFIMIDSIAGYRLSMRGSNLIETLHGLTKYLQDWGVTVLLTNEVENVTGKFMATGAGLSYLADTVIFLRYIELQGELVKAIGVLKKRMGDFEKSMRSLEITKYGIEVGKPLKNLRGILSGIPRIGKESRE